MMQWQQILMKTLIHGMLLILLMMIYQLHTVKKNMKQKVQQLTKKLKNLTFHTLLVV